MTGLLLALLLAAPLPPDAIKEKAREDAALFEAGEVDALWERFSPRAREGCCQDRKEVLEQIHATFAGKYGQETALLRDELTPERDGFHYLRTARYAKEARPVTLLMTLDDEGTIHAFATRAEPNTTADVKQLERTATLGCGFLALLLALGALVLARRFRDRDEAQLKR